MTASMEADYTDRILNYERLDFGFLYIPQGTPLYHSAASIIDEPIRRRLYFFLTPYRWPRTNYEYMYVTTRDIKVLFLISRMFRSGKIVFGGQKLLEHHFGNIVSLSDLDIKQRNMLLSEDAILNIISNIYNMDGWFSSLENGSATEVCLSERAIERRNLSIVSFASIRDYYTTQLIARIGKDVDIEDEEYIIAQAKEDYKSFQESPDVNPSWCMAVILHTKTDCAR